MTSSTQNIPCSNPAICGVRSHRPGTVAKCAGGAVRAASVTSHVSLMSSPPAPATGSDKKAQITKQYKDELAKAFHVDPDDHRLDAALYDYQVQSEYPGLLDSPMDSVDKVMIHRWSRGRTLMGSAPDAKVFIPASFEEQEFEFPEDIVYDLTHGDCWYLAYSLHERTGLPLASIYDEYEEIHHIGVETPDGKIIDIEGVFDSGDWETRWYDKLPNEEGIHIGSTDPKDVEGHSKAEADWDYHGMKLGEIVNTVIDKAGIKIKDS